MKLSEYLKNNDVELTEEQVSKLNKLLEVKESKVWKPKDEEDFYYISAGDIGESTWQGSHTDKGLWEMNEVFKTEEQAEFELEKKKLIVELKRFADENNDEIDWTNLDKYKYYIYYDYCLNKISYESESIYRNMLNIYFSSEDIAKQAIKKFGERIKKYLFEVDD